MVLLTTHPAGWPPGRPPLPQAFIDENKRERCAVALAEIVHEIGIKGLTVSILTKRAKVARGTFYDLFGSQEEALRYACELGNRRLCEAVERAAEGPGPWQARLARAIGGLVEVARTEPSLSELCLVHGRGRFGGADGLYDRDLVAALSGLLAKGRSAGADDVPGPCTEELLAHGILSVLAERLRSGEVASLIELREQIPQLAAVLLRGDDALPSPGPNPTE